MANTIDPVSIFQETLDEVYQQGITSGWMEANASQVRFLRGKTIEIPDIDMDGLADYSRTTGYADGAVTIDYKPHVITQDRGKKFTLDDMDIDESGFMMEATTVMSEFQRTKVVPEVDAYRYSQLFSIANTALKTSNYTPQASDIYQQLTNDITAIHDVIGDDVQLVITMPITVSNILDNADKIEKHIAVDDFTSGKISKKVNFLDEIPIIKVPSSRMKSEYTFGSNGFTPTATAMDVNWIISARTAPIGIIKTKKPKILNPNVSPDYDAWVVAYRKFHDVIMPANKVASLFVSYKSTVAPLLTATVAGGTASGSTKFTATPGAGNTLAYSVTAAAELGYFNTIPTGTTAYTSGDDIAGVTAGEFLNMYELDAAGRVAKFTSYEIQAGDITP